MFLKIIKLINFRQFYGENEIEFSTDKNRNVTLVHGENGVGKTTLLNAILWCLFDHLTDDFGNKTELVCNEAVAEGTKYCRVEIEFEHEGQHYHTQRRFKLGTKDTTFKVHRVSGGNYEEIPQAKSFINSILPSDMAGYFFFHGEGVSSLSDSRSGEKFRRAIRDILGFTFAEAAIDDLDAIRTKQTKELAKHTGIEKEVQRALEDKAFLENQQKELIAKIATIEREIKRAEIEADKFDELILSSGHHDAERAKASLKKREAEADRLKTEIGRLAEDKLLLIQKYGWAIFGYSLANEAMDFIDEAALKGKVPAPYDESLVNDLISDKKCICGRPLEEGSVEFSNVIGMLETANTALIKQRLTKARGVGEKIKGQAQEFLAELRRIEEGIEIKEKGLGANELEQEQLNKELQGFDQGDIEAWQKNSFLMKRRANDLRQKLGANKRELEHTTSAISQKENIITRGGANTPVILRLNEYQAFIKNMTARCKERLDEYESSAKVAIRASVDQILNEFSRKDYRTSLSDDFEFHLIRDDGKKVAQSKGENLLLNLSFVAALIKFAEDRASAQGEFLVNGTAAPFVIDAPFGELDNSYKEATASFLPTHTKQLILFLSSSHWKGSVDKAIRPFIGKEYILVSSRRSDQGSKPADVIEIDGKTYQQSIYSQGKNRTYIEDVR